MENIIENLKQQARDSWSGPTGEERAVKLEAYLRAKLEEYSNALNIPQEDILTAWEKKRNYSAINYYQEANQPSIKSNKVRIFESEKEMLDSLKERKFRCPRCEGVTTNPYECNSGKSITKNKKGEDIPCDWKVYGLFGDLGKGVFIFRKDLLQGQNIFMPIAWEEKESE